MNEEDTQKIIAALTCVAVGYIIGSAVKHNYWARRWNRRNAVEFNGFKKMLDAIQDETMPQDERWRTFESEVDFINIALRNI